MASIGNEIGERYGQCFRPDFDASYEKIIIIGSDIVRFN